MRVTIIERWCNRIIKTGFFLLFALVPLLLTPWNYELFEFNKMIAVYALTVVIVGSWLVKSIAQGEFRLARTPLDLPLSLYLVTQLLSSLFSIDPHVSWFGYYSRFNGGMWSVISYVLLYYTFLSNLDVFSSDADESRIVNREYGKKTKKSVFSIHNSAFNFLKVALITATLVALYGVLERLGIDKHLWVQDVQNRVFSTLGQPNWLAAYLVALTPLAMAFGLKSLIPNHNDQQGKRLLNWPLSLPAGKAGSVFWVLISLLFSLVLLFTRSRSGLLGFAVADLIFWGLLFWQMRAKDVLRLPFIIYHLAFIIILFFNGTEVAMLDRYVTLKGWREFVSKTIIKQNDTVTISPEEQRITGPALEVGGTESGVIRKYVWQGAVTAWRSSVKTILIGTGTETFAWAFFRFRPVEHNLTSEWDFLYNKAHNEYLNYLATTGILGLGSYLLFISSFLVWFVKNLKTQISKLKTTAQNAKLSHTFSDLSCSFELCVLSFALFSGWLSILITNFFGFSVVVTQLFLFLFPAFIFISFQQCNNVTMKQLRLPSWSVWLPVVGGLYVLVKIGFFWYADTRFASGYRLARAGMPAKAEGALSQAVRLRGEPFYYDELGGALATLAISAAEARDATTAASLMKRALSASDQAITTSPQNVNFRKTRTKIYYNFSSIDPQFTAAAIEALERARELSPNDPKIYYNLAILWGRAGDNQKAITLLLRTKELKANYRDVYWALSLFYEETGKKDLAKGILEEYLTKVDPNDKDFLERLR